MNLTQRRLREVLNYDPETGIFTWAIRPCNSVKLGATAGTIANNGYRMIVIDRAHYLAHRLVWLYVHGAWPSADLDHINLDKTDNRIENLREATVSQNMCNIGVSARNKSGFKGVSWSTRKRKWMAYIKLQGRGKNLGYFTTAAAAGAAYEKAARENHGMFARIK